MERGGHFGFPVVDVRVTLRDGKFHAVDSSEMSFKAAGALAFKEALAAAGPCLLEPPRRFVEVAPAGVGGTALEGTEVRRRVGVLPRQVEQQREPRVQGVGAAGSPRGP